MGFNLTIGQCVRALWPQLQWFALAITALVLSYIIAGLGVWR